MDEHYTIRPGCESDLELLPSIERAAARLFVTVGWEDGKLLNDATTVEEHRVYLETGRLWVAAAADDQPVGFAVASMVDGHAHLDEIDVHPDHGRRGIGRALVDQVCVWARSAGFTAITLTTERDIPWNAPFYVRLGFEILADDALTDNLRAILDHEVELGLKRESRVVMIKPL
ncbi:MAG: GNAT family N-acetyltransferase [Anaerolineae bacterium]|nr:GNAT family N-acetyltransferase [Anaerolineae bacterium]